LGFLNFCRPCSRPIPSNGNYQHLHNIFSTSAAERGILPLARTLVFLSEGSFSNFFPQRCRRLGAIPEAGLESCMARNLSDHRQSWFPGRGEVTSGTAQVPGDVFFAGDRMLVLAKANKLRAHTLQEKRADKRGVE